MIDQRGDNQPDKPTLSLIIPALNEEKLLATTVDMIDGACEKYFSSYELILFEDGSTDRTSAIADELAGENAHIQVIHNCVNRGIGYCYREGIRLASMEYTGYLPGDTAGILYPEDIERIFAAVGKAGFVLVYPQDDRRTSFRRQLSLLFTWLMNVIFHQKVRYYNGPNIYPSRILKIAPVRSRGYAAFSEVLVQVLNGGADFIEIGVPNHDRQGNSKAICLRSFWDVFTNTLILRARIHARDQAFR